MTLPQAHRIFEYWRRVAPPTHRLMAGWVGFEPQLTIEEQWAQGAMGPEDFAAYYQKTGGRVDGLPRHLGGVKRG